MTHRSVRAAGLVLAMGAVATAPAQAGIYADDMARCLVRATNEQDKVALVRWIFANAALHPEVKAISAVSPEQLSGFNKGMAQLVERLLTQDCRNQTTEAVRNEGATVLQTSFRVLGEVAMNGLMTDPQVQKGFAEFGSFLDPQKLRDAGLPTN
jgi:hypothetical protein